MNFGDLFLPSAGTVAHAVRAMPRYGSRQWVLEYPSQHDDLAVLFGYIYHWLDANPADLLILASPLPTAALENLPMFRFIQAAPSMAGIKGRLTLLSVSSYGDFCDKFCRLWKRDIRALIFSGFESIAYTTGPREACRLLEAAACLIRSKVEFSILSLRSGSFQLANAPRIIVGRLIMPYHVQAVYIDAPTEENTGFVGAALVARDINGIMQCIGVVDDVQPLLRDIRVQGPR